MNKAKIAFGSTLLAANLILGPYNAKVQGDQFLERSGALENKLGHEYKTTPEYQTAFITSKAITYGFLGGAVIGSSAGLYFMMTGLGSKRDD